MDLNISITLLCCVLPQWKWLHGYENKYLISDKGQILATDVYQKDRWGFHFVRGKSMRISKNRGGYSQICLTKNSLRNTQRVHRLVEETFLPNPENLPCVNHRNEIKTDNRVENLE